MKTYIGKSILASVAFAAVLLTAASCTDFLNILPKGQKIPATLVDYESFLRNEYSVMRTDVTEAIVLDNDRYVTPSYLNYYPLYAANYFWDQTADRVALNKSDESTYYVAYSAISYCNLIVENAPEATEATDAEKNVVIAYAKVVRAMNYFMQSLQVEVRYSPGSPISTSVEYYCADVRIVDHFLDICRPQ